jgi:hypothetical protein
MPGVAAWYAVVRCLALGPLQNPNWVDIYDGIGGWFEYSNTGSTCNQPDEWTSVCSAGTNPSTYCEGHGNYGVWDSSKMNCNAYNLLRDTAKVNCGLDSNLNGGGYADCGCGVYAVDNTRVCLIASFTYHASGTAVIAPDGATSEPEEAAFYYNGHTELRRDTLSKGRRASPDFHAVDVRNATRSRNGADESAAFDATTITSDGGAVVARDANPPAPYALATNAEGSVTYWSVAYQGSCSNVS